MLMSTLLGATAFVSLSADPLDAPRNALGECLRTYVDKAVASRASKSSFARDFAKQCLAEEKALRDAIRAKETAMKTPADQIEGFVNSEIDDLRTNWRTMFEG